MILRRITEHVKAQNWFAVGLDFFIVIAGILIAFQITNWNDARQDRKAYAEAHDRLVEEARRNIAYTNHLLETITPYVSSVEKTIEDLRNCRDDADARDRMAVSLDYIGTTFAPQLETSAATLFNSSERLLEQQPSTDRQRYAEYARRLITFSDFAFQWQKTMEADYDDSHPFLDYATTPQSDLQSGIGSGTKPLVLATSMSEACTDVAFRKIFNRWENGTNYQVSLMYSFRQYTEDFLADIGEATP